MSIHSEKIELEKCKVIHQPDGSVVVSYKSFYGFNGTWNGPVISTPEEAHTLRTIVNQAVDEFLKG